MSVIVRSYRIGQARIGTNTADIQVIYSTLGTLAGLEAESKPHSEAVTFHLKLAGHSWKIDGLRMPPHISQRWILLELRRELAEDRKSGRTDPPLEAAIARISHWQ